MVDGDGLMTVCSVISGIDWENWLERGEDLRRWIFGLTSPDAALEWSNSKFCGRPPRRVDVDDPGSTLPAASTKPELVSVICGIGLVGGVEKTSVSGVAGYAFTFSITDYSGKLGWIWIKWSINGGPTTANVDDPRTGLATWKMERRMSGTRETRDETARDCTRARVSEDADIYRAVKNK